MAKRRCAQVLGKLKAGCDCAWNKAFLTMCVPSAVGCSRTHSAVTLGDWSDPLDPDAEAQMVYRQLLLGRDQLRWVSRALSCCGLLTFIHP